MKLKISQEQFNNLKSRDLVLLECERCLKPYSLLKHHIQSFLNKKYKIRYCSNECKNLANTKKQKYYCKQCNKELLRRPLELKKVKNFFCSHICAGKYNSKHRKSGTRRSKLEFWLEQQLTIIYPNLKFIYNDTSAIEAELDIFIPFINLAFELNGIFHYEPIFGLDKLTKTEKRDSRKMFICAKKQIELCVIDTTSLKYFKEKNAQKFLDIIVNVINKKMEFSSGAAPLN